MKKDIALVLSSGGARGYAHIGAIKVLEKHGFRISSIAGTSMGALVGGIYATGQLQAFEEWSRSLDKMEVLKLTDFSISSKGFVKGTKLINKMKEIVPQCKIEDLPIPFGAVATDILKGEEVVFTKGDLFEAIRASISVPTIFRPIKKGNQYLVDGGLLNPVPVDHVKRSPNDWLVVVDVNANIPHLRQTREDHVHHDNQYLELIDRIKTKLSQLMPGHKDDDIGIFNLSNKAINTMMRRITELTMEKQQPDLIIQISHDAFSAFEFYNAEAIIHEGELATEDALTRSFEIKS